MSAARSVRGLAADLVERALTSKAALRGPLAEAQRSLAPRDRRLLQELVHGSLRWRARLDHVISSAADRPLGRIDRELHAPLRVAAYQLLFLDRVPGYAAVSEAVDEARRRAPRGASFVNAVLRRISRSPSLQQWPVEGGDELDRLAVETSHPRFLVERWHNAFGGECAAAILAANNRRPALQLLAFGDRGGRDALGATLREETVETTPLELSPFALEVTSGDALATRAYSAGDFYVQDQASQAAALVPSPAKGERVLDAAAAPGGKTFTLLAAEPGLEIVAADVDPGRVATLAANRSRLRREPTLLTADLTRPALAGGFDRVIVDLPCSGTGILARHPDLKWRLSESEIGRLAARARELLGAASAQVRPGGLLIAITCSIEREENEEVVEALLAGDADLVPEALEGRVEAALESRVAGPGLVRIAPAERNDGFTVHALRRRR